ncbi:hypothetical protein IQ269_19230 [Tychonema sp. LEGE 07199]|uniref:hypothetical protein n=1 Tax=unclassified Tychonema TaxID=2642144 RepID=UPI001881D4C9|nr:MULTISPECIES: hypothetical protein [unclassified Tychonema]MBE9122871.1 hypothetical protein [Tychonema sp. LEGE 07199]MBE9134726.1 hypothetical protein [Tychonema sp. LEGE 07196]
MANITPGTGATFGATTIEGLFIQLIEYFQTLESAGVNTTNFFSGAYDSDTLIFSGNFSVPVKLNDPVNLNLVGDPDAGGFPSGTFTPRTGGTFTAPLAIDYFMQVVGRLMTLQNDFSKNPQKVQNVTASVNFNRNLLTGSFTVPYAKQSTATGISINAATYLL